MTIDIDPDAGFCFGVVRAIQQAEEALQQSGRLSCLGDIVHNEEEIARLQKKGLEAISLEEFHQQKSKRVLIRAHGEPPERYRFAEANGIELIDATCPIVLQLQTKIQHVWQEIRETDGQIVIFGKKNHAEIIGLNGRINNEGIIIEETPDIENINFRNPLRLFSQTTKSVEEFEALSRLIRAEAAKEKNDDVVIYNTTCRLVSNRAGNLIDFSKKHDVILFVSGRKSSNGKYLYEICKRHNDKSYFISSERDLERSWFEGASSIGITGATSTPQWLMQQVAEAIADILQ